MLGANETLIAINEWVEEHYQNFLCEGVKTLQQTWEKSVELRMDCVLKYLNDFWLELISCVFFSLLTDQLSYLQYKSKFWNQEDVSWVYQSAFEHSIVFYKLVFMFAFTHV